MKSTRCWEKTAREKAPDQDHLRRVPQDEGCINIDGQDVEFKSFEDALKYGISIVNQEIQVIPLASVAENVMLDKIANYTMSGKLN